MDLTFDNITQRVAYAYLRGLAQDAPTRDEPQRDLRRFFGDLYAAVYARPADFGLPTGADASFRGDEPHLKDYKQEVTKQLSKPKDLLEHGMAFLMALGSQAACSEGALWLERDVYAGLVKEHKIKKPFLQGLAGLGLTIGESGEQVAVTSPRCPAMLPAWQALARACAGYADARLGMLNFARVDFRALDGQFAPAALDLYTMFEGEEYERILRLHGFFVDLGYRALYQYYGATGWEVQYQGRSKVKASPLLRVEYALRKRNPLEVDIKCAATNRILPLIYAQPRFLQEDFNRRAYGCNGDKCNWCATRKHLGPSTWEFDGQSRQVCWYSNPDVNTLDDDALRVIEQYALMHEQLG